MAPAHPPNPFFVACLLAALQRGYRRAVDVSGGLEEGFGFSDLNIVNGRRQSAADAYLVPAIHRSNLTFVADAMVDRLCIKRGRCTGVEYTDGDSRAVEVAAGQVVLAAGAIGSPHLLWSRESGRTITFVHTESKLLKTCQGWARTSRPTPQRR